MSSSDVLRSAVSEYCITEGVKDMDRMIHPIRICFLFAETLVTEMKHSGRIQTIFKASLLIAAGEKIELTESQEIMILSPPSSAASSAIGSPLLSPLLNEVLSLAHTFCLFLISSLSLLYVLPLSPSLVKSDLNFSLFL